MKSKYKNAVIFGASQGIGKALAIEYAKHGCNLVLLSRNTEALKEISETINSSEGKCFYKKCDVTIKNDVKVGIEIAVNSLGNIDLVIVNSGLGGPNWMDEFSIDEFIKSFDVNTFGIARILEIVIPIMKNQGYGTIAGVTTLGDVRGYGGSSSYSSSKAAASILLESARVELKKENIKVITVRPGFVKTAMTDKNEFKMPFLMRTDKAAKKIYRGIEKGKSVVQFPWPIVLATRIVKIIPNWIYDFGMNLVRPKKKK
jgi:short-subunit dehydrogenase